MARDRFSVLRALAVALIFPVALAACGRKGALDPPPDAAMPQPAPAPPGAPGAAPTTFIDPTTPTGAAQPAPVRTTQASPAPQVQKKTFFLDPLLQ